MPTAIFAGECKDGMIIAADGRVTRECETDPTRRIFFCDDFEKLHKVDDCLFAAICGNTTTGMAIIQLLKREMQRTGDHDKVGRATLIAQVTSKLAVEQEAQRLLSNNPTMPADQLYAEKMKKNVMQAMNKAIADGWDSCGGDCIFYEVKPNGDSRKRPYVPMVQISLPVGEKISEPERRRVYYFKN